MLSGFIKLKGDKVVFWDPSIASKTWQVRDVYTSKENCLKDYKNLVKSCDEVNLMLSDNKAPETVFLGPIYSSSKFLPTPNFVAIIHSSGKVILRADADSPEALSMVINKVGEEREKLAKDLSNLRGNHLVYNALMHHKIFKDQTK